MEWLFKYLCFVTFLHAAFCELGDDMGDDTGDDIKIDIFSRLLDYISVTLSRTARKQKVIEARLNEKTADRNEQQKNLETKLNFTKRWLEDELAVMTKAVSSENQLVRNLVDSLEMEMKSAIQTASKGFESRVESLEKKIVELTISSDLQSKMESIGKNLDSIETVSDRLEDRIESVEKKLDSVETTSESRVHLVESNVESIAKNLDSIESTSNGLGDRIGSVEKKLDSVETTSGGIKSRVNFVESNMKLIEKNLGSIETLSDNHEGRIELVEKKLDFVETTSAGIKSRMNFVESSVSSLLSASNRKVSFSVQYRPSAKVTTDLFKKQSTIKFNHVFYNEGSGYDVTTGIFTVPISGVYQFIFFVEGMQSEDDFTCYSAIVLLYIDGSPAGSAAFADPRHKHQHIQAGNAYINYFRKGQEVLVRTPSTCDEYRLVSFRTTFSGVLLY